MGRVGLMGLPLGRIPITTRSVSEGHGIPRLRFGLGLNQQAQCLTGIIEHLNSSLDKNRKEPAMAGTERQRELRKRRHRTKKLANLHKKSEKANKTEKAAIVHKLRRLTPGADQLIQAWKLA